VRRRTAGAALLIVFAGAFHDLSWQLVDYDQQGNWRAMTQFMPLLALAIVAARGWRDRFISAACMAVAVMGSTTTLCSAAWFAIRWDPQSWSCSREFSNSMVLLSAMLACVALTYWKR
jgi:hypothetical protein